MLGTLQVTPTFRQMCRSLSLHFASAPECSPGACTHMTRKVAKAASLSCTPEDVAAIALHFYRLASQSLDASEYRNDAALSALQCLICQAEATERPVLSEDEIERNVRGIKRILEQLISSGNGAGARATDPQQPGTPMRIFHHAPCCIPRYLILMVPAQRSPAAVQESFMCLHITLT